MIRYSIKLSNGSDIDKLTKALNSENIEAELTDENNHYCTSANTVLGALASIEWKKIYITADKEIKDLIADFIVKDKE